MKAWRLTVLLAASYLLTGCGGGGSGGPDYSSPLIAAGAYEGTVASTSPKNYPVLILRPNHDLWVFNMTGTSALGFGFGKAVESGTNVSTTAYRYYSRKSGVLDASLAGTFRQGLSLSGTITYPSLQQTLAFTSTFRPATVVIPADLAGRWSASGDESSALEITISAAGDFNSLDQTGCQYLGKFEPGEPRLPVMPLTVTTNGYCRIPNQKMTGIVYFSESELWVGLVTSTGADGSLMYSRTCGNGVTGGSRWSCL